MASLEVLVTDSFGLDAGEIHRREDAVVVEPSRVAMFDQLVDWLSRERLERELDASTMGIAATALCLRWGSYLAVLLDEGKPLEPRVGSPTVSLVADSEMKRIRCSQRTPKGACVSSTPPTSTSRCTNGVCIRRRSFSSLSYG